MLNKIPRISTRRMSTRMVLWDPDIWRKVVRGDFSSVNFETADREQTISMAACMKFTLLKYPQAIDYIKYERWGESWAMHDIFPFAHAVYRNELIGNINFLDSVKYVTIENFPVPSKDVCLEIQKKYPDSASWAYCVTAWSILGNYNIGNLRYAKDHGRLGDISGQKITLDTYPSGEIIVPGACFIGQGKDCIEPEEATHHIFETDPRWFKPDINEDDVVLMEFEKDEEFFGECFSYYGFQ